MKRFTKYLVLPVAIFAVALIGVALDPGGAPVGNPATVSAFAGVEEDYDLATPNVSFTRNGYVRLRWTPADWDPSPYLVLRYGGEGDYIVGRVDHKAGARWVRFVDKHGDRSVDYHYQVVAESRHGPGRYAASDKVFVPAGTGN